VSDRKILWFLVENILPDFRVFSLLLLFTHWDNYVYVTRVQLIHWSYHLLCLQMCF